MDTSRHEHVITPSHPATACSDDLAVVRRPGYNGYAARELVEFRDALFTAYADHLIAAVERVLHHVLSGLPRGPDDADLHSGKGCMRDKSLATAPATNTAEQVNRQASIFRATVTSAAATKAELERRCRSWHRVDHTPTTQAVSGGSRS